MLYFKINSVTQLYSQTPAQEAVHDGEGEPVQEQEGPDWVRVEEEGGDGEGEDAKGTGRGAQD